MIGIYHLLCDHCNLLFTGFVLPGTLKTRRKKKRRHQEDSNQKSNGQVSRSANMR